MAQEANLCQRRPRRQCHQPFTMPGRAVHPNASALAPEDNSIVAENSYSFRLLPKPGNGAFPSPGLTEKEAALPLTIDQPGRVDFNSPALCQQADEQQLVQGIFERVDPLIRSSILGQMNLATRKIGRERCNGVRLHTEIGGKEAELALFSI